MENNEKIDVVKYIYDFLNEEEQQPKLFAAINEDGEIVTILKEEEIKTENNV